MTKNRIEMSKDDIFDGNEENDLIDVIAKQNFLDWLELNGFSEKQLKQLFQEKRISSIEQNRFNAILRKANKDEGISMIEIILYLESNVFKLKKILSVLDENTKHILKIELASKYKIKIDHNMLYKILE